MIDRLPLRSRGFMVLFVVTCVLAGVAAAAAGIGAEADHLHSGALLLAAAMLVLGELIPVSVARWDDTTTETHLSLAVATVLTATGPVWLTIAAMAFALVVDDGLRRRPLFKIVFNVAQYTVSLAAARVVYCLLAGRPFADGPAALTGREVFLMLVGGGVLAVANEVQVTVAASLLLRERVGPPVRHGLWMTAPMNTLLVGCAPVVHHLVFAEPQLVPFLMFPALAVIHSSRVAARRHLVSLTDSLTGLPNRDSLYQRVAGALTDYRAGGAPVALLLLDVDHFKDVNDALGHHTGDLLLTELSRRARRFTDGPGEFAARVGGDEFALLLRGQTADLTTLDARATSVAGQLLATLYEPLDLGGMRLSVQCSAGVVVAPDREIAATELVKRADVALNQAKRERGRYAVYEPAWEQHHTAARLSLLADLRDAVRHERLQVYYQPLVDGASGVTVGVEALCRWHHDEHGWISPTVFIPLAESAGVIDQVTRQVLDQALADVRMWRDNGLDLQVSVNLSPRLVSDASLPAVVAQSLGRHGIEPHRLTVEVTESSVVTDLTRATAVLRELRDIGVRLAMDDFGTGYSSLALLQQLEVDELKVDRSFVSKLDTVVSDAIVVRSTVDLAHSLGLEVVAEGVERPGVAGELHAMGCDRLQGYLFGSAMTAVQILEHSAGHRIIRLPDAELAPQAGRAGGGVSASVRLPVREPGLRTSTMGE